MKYSSDGHNRVVSALRMLEAAKGAGALLLNIEYSELIDEDALDRIYTHFLCLIDESRKQALAAGWNDLEVMQPAVGANCEILFTGENRTGIAIFRGCSAETRQHLPIWMQYNWEVEGSEPWMFGIRYWRPAEE